jgi:hypothetical protein
MTCCEHHNTALCDQGRKCPERIPGVHTQDGGHPLTLVESFVARWLARRLLRGRHHQERLSSFFVLLREETTTAFPEDNAASSRAFLAEVAQDAPLYTAEGCQSATAWVGFAAILAVCIAAALFQVTGG